MDSDVEDIGMTHFMVTGRAGGKTHQLNQWVEKQADPENIVIVVHSAAEAERQRKLWIEKHGPDAPKPRWHTLSEARSGMMAGRHTRIGIDNLDILLKHLFAYPVDFVTATGVPFEARPMKEIH